MATCGIYKIENSENGKFYIGSSDDIHRRFGRHISDLRRNKHDNAHLQNAWNKYGEKSFDFEVVRVCSMKDLLLEEQKDLDIWVGNELCYNMRKDAKCPVAPGSKRPQWVIDKISMAQKGIPRWTDDQKQKMSVDRKGKMHSLETIAKFVGRKHTDETKKKISNTLTGKIVDVETCSKISVGKMNSHKKFSDDERKRVKDGVRKSVLEGRYHKNKVPKEEYETIRGMYLSGNINKRQLAFKYGITPSSMQKLLQRIGV
jgi:group I intron endonuclease